MSPRARTAQDTQSPEIQAALDLVFARGERAPAIERRLEHASFLRSLSPEHSIALDRKMIEEIMRGHRQHEEFVQLESKLEEFEEMLRKLAAPPWYPARLVGFIDADLPSRAVVASAGSFAVVSIGPDVDVTQLRRGDLALLNSERTVLIGTLPSSLVASGETAVFVRSMPSGRIVINARDEEILVESADTIDADSLRPGQRVVWDRGALMALEAFDHEPGRRFFSNDVEPAAVESIGGQDEALDRLLSALTATLVEPQIARLYGVDGRRACLLIGPPGNGKTKMARVAAWRVQELSGRRCRFAVVRPGEFENEYVGATERNIRECFAALREAAEDDHCAVLFLDEIEAIGRTRGSGLGGRHADRFLAALLAEIDGFAQRGNVFIIAATNRKDMIDPALLERLSEIEIEVRRPTVEGARAIFAIHLPETLPYESNGTAPAAMRERMIETAVSLLYSPNAENEICRLRLRDTSARTVYARELVSGRLIEQTCLSARRHGYSRHAGTGANGLRVTDIEQAVAETMTRMTSTLTPRSAASYLDDLSPDNDVVAVEPVRRAVPRPYRHLRAI